MIKKLSRVTKHKRPRCQLYQPGFNKQNRCWLDGGWITVPPKGFTERARRHEKLYEGDHKRRGASQLQQGETGMTLAQKQAWEHHSGIGDLCVRGEDGYVSTMMVDLAAGVPSLKGSVWGEVKVISQVLIPNGFENGSQRYKVVDQTRGVPPDLLTDDSEPVDIQKVISEQNQALCDEFTDILTEYFGRKP